MKNLQILFAASFFALIPITGLLLSSPVIGHAECSVNGTQIDYYGQMTRLDQVLGETDQLERPVFAVKPNDTEFLDVQSVTLDDSCSFS